MGITSLYQEVLYYKDSCKLRNKCYSIFDSSADMKDMKEIVDVKWRLLLRRFPVNHGYSIFLKAFHSYVDGVISRKEFYFTTRSLCNEIDAQIDSLKKTVEKAENDFDELYDEFFKVSAENAAAEGDECMKILYRALANREVKKVFKKLLEY